jgi:hypothetical protein
MRVRIKETVKIYKESKYLGSRWVIVGGSLGLDTVE